MVGRHIEEARMQSEAAKASLWSCVESNLPSSLGSTTSSITPLLKRGFACKIQIKANVSTNITCCYLYLNISLFDKANLLNRRLQIPAWIGRRSFQDIRPYWEFNVTIVTAANTQDETLPPWSGFFAKRRGKTFKILTF